MQPPSAKPSSGCEPSTLLLQRKLLGRDCGKWRTMVRLSAAQRGTAQQLATADIGLDPLTEWRIVSDAADSSFIVGLTDNDPRGWVPMAEYELVRSKKAAMTECLVRMAREMNKLAEELKKFDSSIDDETRPAPLGD